MLEELRHWVLALVVGVTENLLYFKLSFHFWHFVFFLEFLQLVLGLCLGLIFLELLMLFLTLLGLLIGKVDDLEFIFGNGFRLFLKGDTFLL